MKTLIQFVQKVKIVFEAAFFLNLPSSQPDWVQRRLLGPSCRHSLVTVRFTGGPLDGWSDVVEVDPDDRSQARIAIPIAESLLREINGDENSDPAPITSIATYALEKNAYCWNYRFVGCSDSQFAAAIASGLNRINKQSGLEKKPWYSQI